MIISNNLWLVVYKIESWSRSTRIIRIILRPYEMHLVDPAGDTPNQHYSGQVNPAQTDK